jgi:hypothetical protein
MKPHMSDPARTRMDEFVAWAMQQDDGWIRLSGLFG